MIVGTGLDLVRIERLRRFGERRGRSGLRRLFTAEELAYCFAKADPAPSLAARFAAKEAFFKAIRTGWGRGGRWTDVEVLPSEAGAPVLVLHGRARAAMGEAGGQRIHLSLTHSVDTAAAVVVLEA